MVADALSEMIKTEEIREKEARDAAAYAKDPYTQEEIEEAQRHTDETMKQFDDDWTEEYNATR